MEIVEHDRRTSAWGVDDRSHARDEQDDADSAGDTFTIMCAATALAMLLTAVLLLLSSQFAVGLFAVAFSAVLGFVAWLLETAGERGHW